MTACTIMLLLSPVLPQTHPLPSAESDATVDIFLSTYEELGFSKGEREKIFNNVLQPLLRAGLQPLKASKFRPSMLSARSGAVAGLNAVSYALMLGR